MTDIRSRKFWAPGREPTGMTGIAMSAPTESADYRVGANHRVTRSMTRRSRPMSTLIWLSPATG